MSAEMYYFSGTGNSLVVARDLAEKINGTLIPVTAVMDQDRIQTDATVIGVPELTAGSSPGRGRARFPRAG
jgi:flavodoxin